MVAARKGFVDVVQLLIEKRTDINSENTVSITIGYNEIIEFF